MINKENQINQEYMAKAHTIEQDRLNTLKYWQRPRILICTLGLRPSILIAPNIKATKVGRLLKLDKTAGRKIHFKYNRFNGYILEYLDNLKSILFTDEDYVYRHPYLIFKTGLIYHLKNSEYLKSVVLSCGHEYSNAYIDGERYVHRIIAKCFHLNWNKFLQIHHKDSNKLNNALDNLEIVTRSKNKLEFYKTICRVPYNGKLPHLKMFWLDRLRLRAWYTGQTLSEFHLAFPQYAHITHGTYTSFINWCYKTRTHG